MFKLGKSRIFLLFCLAFILGVFIGRYLMPINRRATVMALLAMIFIMLATLGWKKRELILIGFLGLILCLGAARYLSSFPNDAPNFIGRLFGQKVELEGVIVREPDARGDKTLVTLKPDGYVGNVLLTVWPYPQYEYGDRLKVAGKLGEPKEYPDFSYKNYLSRYETYALLYYPKVEKIGSGEGWAVKRALLAVKHKFVAALSSVLPEGASALLLGIILGLKRALPEELQSALVTTGVSHIVVISGYNISIITNSLLKTRGLVGRRLALGLAVLFILAFVIMTGADSSVVRAAVMGLLLVVAMFASRLYSVTTALIFAGAVMIAVSPKILAFDIGFQLSFLATLGLVMLAERIEDRLRWMPNILDFRSNLASTLAAQIFTLPLLVYYFDRLSVVSPLVNVLILWAVPYIMFFGMIVGLAALASLPLGLILGFVVWLLLTYCLRVINFFAHLPGAAFSLRLSIAGVGIYYLLLAWALSYPRLRRRWTLPGAPNPGKMSSI